MSNEFNSAQLEAIEQAEVYLNNVDLPSYRELLTAHQYEVDRKAREEENQKGAREQALAQMSSISEMVAALECDYDRLQELRDEKKVCTAGWNMPGYLPDSAPESFDSWEDAAEFLADELERSADEIEADQSEYIEKAVDLRKQAVHVRTSTGELSFYAADGLVYWINTAEKFGLDDDDFAELQELEEAAGDCEDADEARERIQEDPLSVEVRSGWTSLNAELQPEEFAILLCTGGPAVRIVGELDQYKQPCRAWLEYQDWFTPWTELVDGGSHSDLLTYCQQFYFGEY